MVLVTQSCPTLCNPMDCSLPYSSIHGVFQARVLEWVAISFSRGSSQPRDQTWVSRIVVRCFTIWATREVTLFQSRSKYKMIPRIKFKPYHVISGSTWQEPMNKINKMSAFLLHVSVLNALQILFNLHTFPWTVSLSLSHWWENQDLKNYVTRTHKLLLIILLQYIHVSNQK